MKFFIKNHKSMINKSWFVYKKPLDAKAYVVAIYTDYASAKRKMKDFRLSVQLNNVDTGLTEKLCRDWFIEFYPTAMRFFTSE